MDADRSDYQPCVFCDIVAGRAPAEVVRDWERVIAIVPLNPVTEGHVLVIPKYHVTDAVEAPWTAGEVFRYASDLAERPCNIITSAGVEATQTVFHLHVHIVPRREGDGLALPWTDYFGRTGDTPMADRRDAIADALDAYEMRAYAYDMSLGRTALSGSYVHPQDGDG